MQWNLMRIRKEHGLSQAEFGEILGMKPGAYGRKERGEQEFRISEMIAIHLYFKISMDQIFLPPNSNYIAVSEELQK